MEPSENKPIIVVKNLTARFGDNVVFEDVSFEVYKGEVLVIVGESGCGKSTLLKIMIGLQKPSAGQVLYQGTDITHAEEKDLNLYRQNIGVLFQSGALFSSMTIKENIALPLSEYTDLDPDSHKPDYQNEIRHGQFGGLRKSSSVGTFRRHEKKSRHRPGHGARSPCAFL